MSFLHKFNQFVEGILGEQSIIIYALLAFVVLDYMTGICVAIYEKKLSSRIGAKGIIKKVMIFIILSLSAIADYCLLGNGNILTVATATFYCVNESISILENASRCGLPLPKKILQFFKALDKDDK